MITIRPEWVMVGFPADATLVPCEPGQVVVLASTKLSRAELEYTERTYHFDSWEQFTRAFRPHHTLAVELDDFVVVVADTYPEALAKLLTHWTPTGPPAVGPAAHRQLTAVVPPDHEGDRP